MSQGHICLPSGADGIRTPSGRWGVACRLYHSEPKSNKSARKIQTSSLIGAPLCQGSPSDTSVLSNDHTPLSP